MTHSSTITLKGIRPLYEFRRSPGFCSWQLIWLHLIPDLACFSYRYPLDQAFLNYSDASALLIVPAKLSLFSNQSP